MAGWGNFIRVRTVVGDERYLAELHPFKLLGIDWEFGVGFWRGDRVSAVLRTKAKATCYLSVRLFVNDDLNSSLNIDVVNHTFAEEFYGELFERELDLRFNLTTLEDVDINSISLEIDFDKIGCLYDGVPVLVLNKNQGIMDISRHCGLTEDIAKDVAALTPAMYGANFSKDARLVYMGESSSVLRYVRLHASVLQSSSDILGSMPVPRHEVASVCQEFQPVLSSDAVIPFHVDGISFEGLVCYVRYLYGISTAEEILKYKRDLILINNKFVTRGLGKLCLDCFRYSMEVANVFHCLRFADQYTIYELMDVCIQFLFEKMMDLDAVDFEDFCHRDASTRLLSELRKKFVGKTEVLALMPPADDD